MWHCDVKGEAMNKIGMSYNCNRSHLLTNCWPCRDTESHIFESSRVTTRHVPMSL